MTHAIQAGAVAIAGRAIVILGPPGIGKSSLALVLIDRGAELVGDDGIVLTERDGALFAGPHPNTRGLIEVRNLGILTMPVADTARVCLAITLDKSAPRHIDRPDGQNWLGVSIPHVALYPDGVTVAVKAELALDRFGLAAG